LRAPAFALVEQRPRQDSNQQNNSGSSPGQQGPTGTKDDPMHVNVTNQPSSGTGDSTGHANMTSSLTTPSMAVVWATKRPGRFLRSSQGVHEFPIEAVKTPFELRK
jgi:hypothetical protein